MLPIIWLCTGLHGKIVSLLWIRRAVGSLKFVPWQNLSSTNSSYQMGTSFSCNVISRPLKSSILNYPENALTAPRKLMWGCTRWNMCEIQVNCVSLSSGGLVYLCLRSSILDLNISELSWQNLTQGGKDCMHLFVLYPVNFYPIWHGRGAKRGF